MSRNKYLKYNVFRNNSLVTILSLFLICLLFGCSNEEPIPSNIIGTWYGTRSYVNPVSGTKYQYLTVTFNQDKTGKMEYESPVSYSIAYFTYSISSNTIKCNGSWASTYGDVAEDFTTSFKIKDDRLIPQDKYDQFILTKDNSVMTDGNGNEVIDQFELLQGVWINTNGYTVVKFNSSTYKEWVLSSKNSNEYDFVDEDDYSYDAVNKTLRINSRVFDIMILNESELKLYYNNDYYCYKKGTESNIPTKINIKGFLTSAGISGWSTSKKDKTFVFYENGVMSYFEKSGVRVGSWTNNATLCASGQFSVSGTKFIGYFSNVSWEGGAYSEYKNLFPGWNYDTPCTKEYTVEVISSEMIRITYPDGNSYLFYMN